MAKTSMIYDIYKLGSNIRVADNFYNHENLTRTLTPRNLSALNNYVRRSGAQLYLEPLENDLFDNVVIRVIKDAEEKPFAMNLKPGKIEFNSFMKELYKNVENALKGLNKHKESPKKTKRFSIDRLIEIYNDKRLEFVNRFIKL
ncbi:hypothetical protein IJ579_00525 [bacterium]|nr:hypothetical protein [bacterium]